jgi:beta-lactamase regulating signal transducer with metallopeptidase domain
VAGRLALDRAVRIVESSAVSVPAMIGWMKPVILLPAAALSGLTPGQLEALIAHELAHVRRHDYLVNLLQTAVETLLFYHPAVWWASRQVRTEREHCCDDLAVGVCDRVAYVTALANLAAFSARPRFAMAATGGSLLRRVRRLLGQPPADHGRASGWIAALAIATIGGALVAATTRVGSDDQTTAAAATESASADNRAVAPNANVVPPALEQQQAPAQTTTASSNPVGVQAAVAAQAADATRLEELQRALAELAAAQQAQAAIGVRDQARAEALQRDAKEYERLLQLQSEIDRKRIELEARAREVQSQVLMSRLQAEFATARDAMARAKRQYEVGLASEDALRQAESQVRALERQLDAAMQEQDLHKAEIQLKLREAEIRREAEMQRLMLEQTLREKMPAAEAQVDALRARIRDLETMLESRYALSRQGAADSLANTVPVTDPNEEVRPGDLLVIEIVAEPDLPRHYQVRSDGTIRLPLIGSVRVGGSTATQVRDDIAKQMADRKLGTDRGVAVSLRRPRGES